MKAARILLSLLLPVAAVLADGFHSPLVRGGDPKKWATTVREDLGLDRSDSADGGPAEPGKARAAAGPLLDLLRYLDRQNILLREFPDFNYDDIPGFKSETESILIAIGVDAVPFLVQTLVTDLKGETVGSDLKIAEDFLTRVVRILVAIGEDAVDGLAGALAEENPKVRKAITGILGKIVRDPDFGEDVEAWRRWHRVWSAGRRRDAGVLPDLFAALADEDRRIRLAAVRALAGIGAKAAGPELRAFLAPGTEAGLLKETIRAVVRIGDVKSAPLLIDLLENLRLDIREEASTGLCFLARTSMGFDPRAPEADRQSAIARWRSWWANR